MIKNKTFDIKIIKKFVKSISSSQTNFYFTKHQIIVFHNHF